ncbi:MAG: MFS transporter, partial [Chloroflexi bacterium]|nr:MFS transporter [Chloroflexota bacterium]
MYALHATAFEMGILTAAGPLAYLLVGLPAGAWVDRLPRRPVMIVSDLGRAILLASIPIAAILGLLTMAQLSLVALLVGVLAVFFDVAYQSLLPSVVRSDQLLEANSKLQVGESVTQVAGPGVGGGLVQLLGAPVAIAADAVSFVLSAFSLALVRAREPAPSGRESRNLGREIRVGVATVLRTPSLGALAGASLTFHLFDNVLLAVYVLYMTRTLHFPSTLVGLIFGLGGVGGLVGATVAERVTTRFGHRRVMLGGIGIAAAGELTIAGARDPILVAVIILLTAETLVEFGGTLYGIDAASFRQATVPGPLQGRVTATMRVISWGVGSLGALAGGVLGGAIGVRPTVLIAGVGSLFSILWLFLGAGVESLPGNGGPGASEGRGPCRRGTDGP